MKRFDIIRRLLAHASKPRPFAAFRTIEPLESRTLFASYFASTPSELITTMTAANQSAEADTITLAAGTTFTLTSRNNTVNGLPVIAPNSGLLTIIGNGSTIERSTATGTWEFRLFEIAPGGSLTLKDLTARGGLVAGGWYLAPGGSPASKNPTALSVYSVVPALGGAILNNGSLTLDGVTVRDNFAQGLAGWVYFGGAFLPGVHSAGGGIYSTGALTVTGCTITNNSATGGKGWDGGQSGLDQIVYWSAGPGAGGSGGGIYIAGGSASITSCNFSSNSASGGAGGNYRSKGGAGADGLGGGLYAAAGVVTVRNTSITTNAALGGAGGVARQNGKPGRGVGGGLYIDRAASVGLDSFTKSHTILNAASSSHNDIFGTSSLIP